MSEKEITSDSNYLYIDGEKFFPLLQEVEDSFHSLDSVNGIVIQVNCAKDADFNWEEARDLAERVVAQEKWILWDLDFQLQEGKIFLQDTSSFFSAGIAVEEFIKTLWTPYRHQTLGACIFRGGVDFVKYFVWTELHEQHYLEKKKESPFLNSSPSLDEVGRKLYAADVFSDYLHRLSSFLPDTLLPFCLLDVSSVASSAFLSILLSKERFQHLILALKRTKLPLGCLNWEEGECFGGWIGRGLPYFSAIHDVTLGVCIPLEENMTEDLMKRLEDLFVQLSESQTPYRILSELYLNESWSGIDELIVFTSAVSSQGLRKLKGFLAAGGQIIHAENPLGLESEISLLEFSRR